MEIGVSLREDDDGRWTGVVPEGQALPSVFTRAATQGECLAKVRRSLERSLSEDHAGEPLSLFVEVVPRLAGVAEAAEIMGWDKRRVITYLKRGSFPPPIASLASGRVWRRGDVEAYAAARVERARSRTGSIAPP